MALSETVSDAVQLMNNAVINNPDCEVFSNSTSSSAIHLNNNAQIAGKATTAGNILIDNGATVGKRVTGAPRQHDPYANLELVPSMAGPCKDPMSGGVPQPVNWGSGTNNLTPGRWCKGWRASNGATLNLSPGVYFVEQAFDMNNNITINGTGGVTIVVGSGVTPNWSNNTRIRLTAPTTGTTAGLVLTQFTDDTSQRDFNFANNLDFTFTGAIYLPTKSIKVQNNGTLATADGTNGCGHVVAYRVWLSNNATLGNNCAGVGVSPFGTEGSDWAPGGSTGAAIVE